MNISIKEASKLMGVSEQYLRQAMKQKLLNIGFVKESPNGYCSYYISPKLFEEYTGIKVQKKEENVQTTNQNISL